MCHLLPTLLMIFFFLKQTSLLLEESIKKALQLEGFFYALLKSSPVFFFWVRSPFIGAWFAVCKE